MKHLPLVLAAGSLLAACKTTAVPVAPARSSSQPFELVMQQAAGMPTSSGGPISLTLTEVQDSRCPSGGQCIWAGYAAVVVQLTDATATPQTARLTILNNYLPTYTRDSVSVTLNQRRYWLRLLDVTPYPGTGSGQPAKAKLRLRPA